MVTSTDPHPDEDVVQSEDHEHWGGTSRHVWPVVVKVLFLGTAIALAISISPMLVTAESWLFLAAVWAIVAVLLATYATQRAQPFKYLVPGLLMLALFVIYPIILTAQTSFTNYGDGTRSTKEEAVAQIVGSSVVQTPDAPRYNLSVGTTGSVATGPFTFFLVSQEDGTLYKGTEDGLEELDEGDVTVENDKITAADGYTMLDAKQINAAGAAIEELTVPTEDGAIRALGITTAFEGTTTLEYDAEADTITDVTTGTVYTVQQQGDREFYVDDAGNRVSDQSWKANVGLDNYKKLLTNPEIRSDFVSIFIWTFLFATLSVATTFVLGLLLAITLNDPRMRGQKVYRAVLIMPYAIPGFISLLVWSSFFNRDFGLINDVTGLNINWFGEVWNARAARADHEPVDGFPLHVPGVHGCSPGDPVGAARGRQDRRRQRLQAPDPHHLPADAGERGPAAGRVVRVQLQQLQRHLPAHRGRPVLAGQPDRRRHRHPDQLHHAVGLRRRRRTDRLRLGGVGRAVRHHRRHRRPAVPRHEETRRDELT